MSGKSHSHHFVVIGFGLRPGSGFSSSLRKLRLFIMSSLLLWVSVKSPVSARIVSKSCHHIGVIYGSTACCAYPVQSGQICPN